MLSSATILNVQQIMQLRRNHFNSSHLKKIQKDISKETTAIYTELSNC
jgi:hypothetical protein